LTAVSIIDPTSVRFTSGVYWRRSKWNGRKCEPVILTVDQGRLRMSTADAVVFDVPCASVSAKFSRAWTMTVTVDGTGYDFVGRGSGISKAFTAAQLDEIRAAHATAAGRDRSGATVAAGTGAAGLGAATGDPGLQAVGGVFAAAGLAQAAFEFSTLRAVIRPWRDVLTAAGVAVAR
jgi:hypothetical protein